MNKKIVAINDTDHDRVQKLLPWFVVDTLHGAELALVNQHLNVCTECQADFAWQCKLQAIEPASEVTPDVDRAFAKLRERIDVKKVHPKRQSGWFSQLGFANRPWMQWALAVQMASIVALVFLVAAPDGTVASYRALSSATTAGNVADGNLIVIFKADTSEQELRRILNSVAARIVDGPTVTDAYVLHVSNDRLGATLRSLRANRNIILAESLTSRSKP
jgi:hypothetical protein